MSVHLNGKIRVTKRMSQTRATAGGRKIRLSSSHNTSAPCCGRKNPQPPSQPVQTPATRTLTT